MNAVLVVLYNTLELDGFSVSIGVIVVGGSSSSIDDILINGCGSGTKVGPKPEAAAS